MRTQLAVALVVLAQPLTGAAAGIGEAGLDGLTNIPASEWSAMASGRTLTYTIDGEFWAMERYDPGSNRVTLQFYDGTCLQGVWEYAEPLYCFHWEGEGTSCFRHARLGDDILILETEGGVETGAVQNMVSVSDAPLACGPAIIS